MLTIIAAVAKNNVIGNYGKMPWNIPDEMAIFKNITMSNPVILGRKTFESIGYSLPGRHMYVLSRRSLPLTKGELEGVVNARGGSVTFCSSIQDSLDNTKKERTVFVIGGGDVYAQMMPLAQEMRISHLNKAFEGDCYFPDIDPTIWRVAEQQEFPDFIHTKYTLI